MRDRNPELDLVMFRSTPMFTFGPSYTRDGYVMFTAAAQHFSAHSIQFDLVAQAQESIPGAFGGKGSVNVRYPREDAKPGLKHYVDEVLRRHGLL